MSSGHVDTTKLKPLTKHARAVLNTLRVHGPIIALEINPGVRDRFLRGGLAEFIDVPNPYKTKAKTAQAMRLTHAGLVELITGEG